MASSPLWLRVAPTYNCNKQCNHCYARTRAAGVNISESTMNMLVQVFKNHVEKYGLSRFTSILFVGGEPTLVVDKVKYLINSFREVIPGLRKIDPYFGICINTNGLNLNSGFLDWCRDNKVKIRISLNDLPLVDFCYKLKMLRDMEVDFSAFITLTEDALNNLKEILGRIHEYTDRAVMCFECNAFGEESLELFDKKVPEAIQWCLDTNHIFNPEAFYESRSLSWAATGKFHHACGSRYVLVDPNGDVNSCIHYSTFIGNIYEENFDFLAKLEASNPPRFHYEGIPACEECDYKLVCGGGCPQWKLHALGRTDVPDIHCKTNKKVIPLLQEMSLMYSRSMEYSL